MRLSSGGRHLFISIQIIGEFYVLLTRSFGGIKGLEGDLKEINFWKLGKEKILPARLNVVGG